jgi:hypothetical protein
MIPADYILLDAARVGEQMDKAKELNTQNHGLYNKKGEEYLRTVAPYLFSFNENDEFINWFKTEGWGSSWGVLINSRANMEQLNAHFRNHITAKTEDSEEFYFRFYDPRVLRVFLPTCSLFQLKEFFGPVSSFTCEHEDQQFAIKFWLENGQLRSHKMPAEEIFSSEATIQT